MAVPSSGSMHRQSARRRTLNRCLCHMGLWLILILAVYQVLWSHYLAGINVPDIEYDKMTGEKRIRRRPHKLFKRDHEKQIDVPT